MVTLAAADIEGLFAGGNEGRKSRAVLAERQTVDLGIRVRCRGFGSEALSAYNFTFPYSLAPGHPGDGFDERRAGFGVLLKE